MKHKILISLIFGICLINLVSSFNSNNFSNFLCYQETANASNVNDGNCGLNYNGNYYFEGFNDPIQIFDGNWNTFGLQYNTILTSYFYVNYTKPVNNVNNSIWSSRYGYAGLQHNTTLPNECLNQHIVQIKMTSTCSSLYCVYQPINSYCYNYTSSDWILIDSQSGYYGNPIYEEAIYWNISSLSNENLTFNSNSNITKYLSIPQNTILTNAYLNLSSDSYPNCYQETANNFNINDGNCNLNYSGNYIFNIWWFNQANSYDGDFGTFSDLSSIINDGYMYINYSKQVSSTGASWRIMIDEAESNNPIFSDCFNYTNLELRLRHYISAGDKISGACYNGSAWRIMFIAVGTRFEEEAINWSTNLNITNPNIYISNKIWEYTDLFNQSNNKTDNLAQSINLFLSTCSYVNGYCNVPFIFHSDTAGILQYSDLLFNNDKFIENSQTFNNNTFSNSLEIFSINLTYDSHFYNILVNLTYNNTQYTTTPVGSGIYTIFTRTINVPSVSSQINKTFYYNITLTNSSGSYNFNSSYNNQTINSLNIDNCSTGSVLILNYTMFDENTQNLIPDSNGLITDIELNLYDSDYSTLISTYVLSSNKNNTNICLNNNLTSQNYYMDVITQYNGGTNYVTKFNNIQKFLLNNSTIPINVPLYDLITNNSQEFTVTFKDSNFIKQPNVLVDVTRKYIPEGVFKSVEVAKTDANGQTILHLQKSTIIYTIYFKYNGQIISILSNVLAKCQSDVLGTCEINTNAYASTTPTQDFNYINGVNLNENFNKDTRTIIAQFTSNSGTKTMVLNVTKFDILGNQTVCTDTVTSSSGTLSCVIPAGLGDITVVSEVYADNDLIKLSSFSINTNPDISGSTVILALMIVITLSLLFITDIRGIMLGCFLGLILSGLLLFINQGNLFSIGSAVGFLLSAGIIILWKISQKDERG